MLCCGCGVQCSDDDNFCRSCGRVLGESKLALRTSTKEPVLWQGVVPVLVRGLGGMAVGAVAEMAIRSFVRTALRRLVPLFSLDQKDVVRSAISHEQISSGEDDCIFDEAILVYHCRVVRR